MNIIYLEIPFKYIPIYYFLIINNNPKININIKLESIQKD
jgi:hypothetical protein